MPDSAGLGARVSWWGPIVENSRPVREGRVEIVLYRLVGRSRWDGNLCGLLARCDLRMGDMCVCWRDQPCVVGIRRVYRRL